MKVKCIGGPNDGEWHYIEDYNRLNDMVQIRGKIELSVGNYLPHPDEIPKIVSQNINLYILKQLHYTNKEVFKYLIPVGEDEWECLVKQLEK